MAARDDKLLTVDTHHHMLADFFWQEALNDAERDATLGRNASVLFPRLRG